MKLSAMVLLVAAGLAKAQQPNLISTPQAPGPVRTSAGQNQASMTQIINQLNQRQLQLNVVAAQAAAQRRVFVPQTIIVKPAK